MRSGGSAARRHTLIVVAVAVVAGLLVAAFLLGRRSPSAEPAPANPSTGSPSAGAASTPASSSAGTSGASDTLPRGQAVSTGGGSKTGPEGVVLGYPHTSEGAVSAVANYVATVALPGNRDPKVAAAVAEAIAAPGSAAGVQHSLNEWTSITAIYDLSAPVSWGAYSVRSYSDSEAVIAMWSPLVFAQGAAYTPDSGEVDPLLGARWGIWVYRVVWADGDWKWIDFDGVDSVNDNVAPASPDMPPSAQEKSDILHRPNPSKAASKMAYQAWDWMEYADA